MRELTEPEIERADDWINAHKIIELGGKLHLDDASGEVVAAAPKSLPVTSLVEIGIAMISLSSSAFPVLPTVEERDGQILIGLDLSEADELAEALKDESTPNET